MRGANDILRSKGKTSVLQSFYIFFGQPKLNPRVRRANSRIFNPWTESYPRLPEVTEASDDCRSGQGRRARTRTNRVFHTENTLAEWALVEWRQVGAKSLLNRRNGQQEAGKKEFYYPGVTVSSQTST